MKVILNDRQFKIIEVLKRQESCLTSYEIAKKLSISSKTVQNEILDINKKYKKRDRKSIRKLLRLLFYHL